MNAPEIVARSVTHAGQVAIVDGVGEHTYKSLLEASARTASTLLEGSPDLNEARVAFMVKPSFDWVRTQWGIWRAGGIATPLCLTHPPRELAYVLDDSRPTAVIADPEFETILRPVVERRGIRWLSLKTLDNAIVQLPDVAAERRAMILYTSGTTGPPKGVVTTHRNISAQVKSLVEAWDWSCRDRILLNLPLHHLHGILNVLSCALWVGATCEILPRFDASAVWNKILAGQLTLFMAVPTIYHRLITCWENADPDLRDQMSAACQGFRLMVSGSAALPVPMLDRWREISGHTLLERYGMTEIGMALSNPLHGERLPGHVGSPLPGVEVRLSSPKEGDTPDVGSGELQVRGNNVFREYWGLPEATKAAFTIDGRFKTGDIATEENGVFRILGRSSVDILKSGGEKVSALEIENVLMSHPYVSECAVVGIPDFEWGHRVVAALVPAEGVSFDKHLFNAWCQDQLASYKVPKEFVILSALPRNAMGKVMKTELVRLLT